MILEFTKVLNDSNVSIYSLNDYFGTNNIDYDIVSNIARIDYGLSMNVKSWGVKCMELGFNNMIIELELDVRKEGLENNDLINLASKGFKDHRDVLSISLEFNVNSERCNINESVSENGMININYIEYDMVSKIVEIY